MADLRVKGRVFGVGVGPGDPDLMTIRARRLIRNARVIAYPAPDTGQSFARSVAAGCIPVNATEIPIIVPMSAARFPAQGIYDRAERAIGHHLVDGKDVVVLCQGDPFFYGSFMYLFQRLSGAFHVVIVPGVSSLTSCAAVAAMPLCARSEVLTIIPATLGESVLEDRLSARGAAAIVKVGRHVPKIRRVLRRLQKESKSVLVAHATLPQQQVVALADAADSAPYFSTVLVPGTDPYANG